MAITLKNHDYAKSRDEIMKLRHSSILVFHIPTSWSVTGPQKSRIYFELFVHALLDLLRGFWGQQIPAATRTGPQEEIEYGLASDEEDE
jgi:hypothetical protein